MKSLYKKTTSPVEILRKISFGITLIYLLSFLFSFFIPFNKSFAQDATNRLIITTDSPNTTTLKTIKQDENTRITAKLYTAVGGEIVSFSTTTILSSFTPQKTCTIPKRPETTLSSYRIESCFVNFKTGTAGSPTITASVSTDGKTYSSNLKLIVLRCDLPNTIINNICTPPEITKPEPKINTDTIYTPLAPLPGLEESFDTLPSETNKCPFGNYLNIMIKLILGIAAVLAMVMITMGGIQYMTSDLVSSKEAGKETVTNAILGLLIGLGAWLILNTINPALLNACLDRLPQATVTIEPLYDRGSNDPKQANGESTRCTPVSSGSCSVANLTTIFGAENAVAMSKICNMESGGTNATSTTDICKPGNNAFSFGLFQVNLASNGTLAGSDCVGLFDKSVKGSDAISPKYTSGFTCSLLSGKETLYNTCKARLLNPTTNLAIAKKLFTPSKNAWTGDKKYCASAFK